MDSEDFSTDKLCTNMMKYKRPRRGAYLWRRILFVTVVFCLAAALSNLAKFVKKNDPTAHRTEPNRLYLGRRLQSADVVTEEGVTDGSSENNTEEEECTPSTIEEFPPDFFTDEQRSKGAVVVHFLIAIYMFVALAIVCDDYFVSSLEKICEKLGFSEDVAGATFMAAGSSAPELFTSIIGVFIAEGDVGVGTIVGSAVFNILVIIGLCAIFAGSVVPLTWWPMARDTMVYALAVVTLMFVIFDGLVVWYESVIMLSMYAGYIFLMWLNPKIYLKIQKAAGQRKAKKRKDVCNNSKSAMQLEQAVPLNTPEETGVVENGASKPAVPMVDEYICNSPKRLTFQDAGFRVMLSNKFPARTRMRTACWLIITEKQMMEKDPEYSHYLNTPTSSSTNGTVLKSETFKKSSSFIAAEEGEAEEEGHHHIILGEPEGVCNIPDGVLGVIRWIICLPLSLILFISVPDCRKQRFERWYIVTFVVSIGWIMVFSYIMVWMVALIGYTMGIPDTIMGITFLAAGTSVPDAMASLIVARQGLGDMAVSNSIGSNVFDILLGLALPWFLKTVVTDNGSQVSINSRGLKYSVTLLLATVFITITCIHFFKWKLNRPLGILLLCFYVLFLTLCSMVEFNVFGYVNPPICKH